MTSQAVSSLLYILFIFIYKLFGKYEELIVINGIVYDPKVNKNMEVIFTDGTIRSSAVYFVIWAIYLVICNYNLFKNEVIGGYRIIFKWTSIFFCWYVLSESVCLVYPDLFYLIVKEINIYFSGFLSTVFFFLILTYKSMKYDRRK